MNNYSSPKILYCKYCNKLCTSNNSLVQHEIRCKSNPDRISCVVEGFNNLGRVAWNKDKTKETDSRVNDNALKVKQYYETHVGSFTGKTHSDEYKKHMSDIAIQRQLGGFNMRKARILHKGVKLDSSYELSVAVSLDANGVAWERCERFPYHYDDGSCHYYTPDFYLPEYNVYLDPKNDFLINNVNEFTGITDIEKINRVEQENQIRIIVLDKDSLDWESILELINAPVA